MTVFWLNLLIVFLLSLYSRIIALNTSIGAEYRYPDKTMVIFATAMLVLVSGLRNGIGDTFAYMHSYSYNQLTWDKIDFSGDFGFNIFQMYLQKISQNPQLLIFVTALITNVLIVMVLYKYSKFFELAIYVYITSGAYTVSMNGIRQFLAASIIFLGTKYLMNGDWKKYFAVVIFASFIHKSALLLIPIYFIARRKAWSLQTLALLGGSIVIVIGFNQFMGALFSVIESTQYGQYQSYEGQGANVIRVIVAAAPLIIAFIGRERLKELNPNIDVILNMSIINLLFMIISTQNWIFARFSIYFSLYQFILISWIVLLFKQKQQKLIYFIILVSYLGYFYYESVISLNLEYVSDYIKW